MSDILPMKEEESCKLLTAESQKQIVRVGSKKDWTKKKIPKTQSGSISL